MHSKSKLRIFVIILSTLIISLGIYFAPKIERKLAIKEVTETNKKVLENFKTSEENKQKLLKVQFICQAPLRTEGNWEFHEESCEEAALLQAYDYETGNTITREQANEKILNMIDWQKDFFGSHKDLYDEDMKSFATNYLYLQDEQFVIMKNATLKDIKDQIDKNHPVIVGVTSQYLENPYYPHPGYHMLTVIGYTEEFIITNDNGTCRGKSFAYGFDKFEKAMQDAGSSIYIINLGNI
ncbi:C39 family peptidase [Candidatus Peregrinibacteria bacterium]|nr:C39 family peptidase [Candidatus Peregrinibacteria bacterium]